MCATCLFADVHLVYAPRIIYALVAGASAAAMLQLKRINEPNYRRAAAVFLVIYRYRIAALKLCSKYFSSRCSGWSESRCKKVSAWNLQTEARLAFSGWTLAIRGFATIRPTNLIYIGFTYL